MLSNASGPGQLGGEGLLAGGVARVVGVMASNHCLNSSNPSFFFDSSSSSSSSSSSALLSSTSSSSGESLEADEVEDFLDAMYVSMVSWRVAKGPQ